jgi:hypothetical protein
MRGVIYPILHTPLRRGAQHSTATLLLHAVRGQCGSKTEVFCIDSPRGQTFASSPLRSDWTCAAPNSLICALIGLSI